MSKIPTKPIIEAVKACAPKVGDFIKKNPKIAIDGLDRIVKTGKELLDTKENRFEKKQRNGKVPYREIQHRKYQNEILPKLDLYSYIKLISYKNEVESFIKQINQEEAEQLFIRKPLHSKHSKSWNQILIQIEDKIKNRNYEELLKAYYSPTYEGNYFDAKVINDMRNIENKNELYKYIHRYTEKNMKDIEKYFF